MKRVLKWIVVALLSLIAVMAIGGAALHFVGLNRLNNAPDVTTRPVSVPTDPSAIARGEHLVNVVSSCRLCHGDNLGGELFIDGEMGMYVFASNLTSGQGGIGASYSDADWERALRHGVGADDRVLVIMPANYFQNYSDADLGAVIAYLRTVPPVDNDLGSRSIGFPGSVLGGVLGFDDFTRIKGIDHASAGSVAPQEGPTVEYGGYLVRVAMCGECHGPDLAGLSFDDDSQPSPNLTPGGELIGWEEQDFMTALRTGVTPTGRRLDGEQMPWPTLGQMTDTELRAIWAYLQAAPLVAKP